MLRIDYFYLSFCFWLLYACPAERRRRSDQAHQSATANGTRAESNGGPTVSSLWLDVMLLSCFYLFLSFSISVSNTLIETPLLASTQVVSFFQLFQLEAFLVWGEGGELKWTIIKFPKCYWTWYVALYCHVIHPSNIDAFELLFFLLIVCT